ncbi:MAG: endolytic transglycosylase MltG [Ruminococcaceae bacterium]|nr:endolytic transglycosylase MltG [Oscillospiraceae bacterium]
MDQENYSGPGAPEDNDEEARAWLEQLLAAAGQEEPPAEEEKPPENLEDSAVYGQMVAPAEAVAEIGTDETAVAHHDMTDMGDIEVERIIRETLDDDWDITAIENEIMSEPIAEAFDEDPTMDLTDDVLPEDEEYAEDAEDEDDGEDGEEEYEGAVPRKVRPKKKNGYGLFGLPHLASLAIWVAICLFIGTSLGRLIWICAADIMAFGREDQDVVVTIAATDDLDDVIEKLHKAGLIQYKGLFKLYCQLADVEEEGKISAGVFTLNTQYDYHALVGGMSSTSSYRQTTEVVIPEGYTCAQIFKLLEDRGVCTVAELEQYCSENEFSSYWFLEGVEKGTPYCLEGYLFPDTYEFYTNSSARQVLIKLLGGFEYRFNDELKAQLDELNETLAEKYKKNGFSQSYIEEHKLTLQQLIIVASMIEKETAYSGESPTIASVIYNRLTNPSKYPFLNIDATIVYALGGKQDLTAEDLKFDSPYNTYLYEGLPPGPISNPGIYSIRAALAPAATGYYYYALDTSGESPVHQFFKTYNEHQDFLKNQE